MAKIKRHIEQSVRKVVKQTPILKKVAKKVKSSLIQRLETAKSRSEIYDKHTFYPTIQEYFDQTKLSQSSKGPLISILLPTYNTPSEYLRDCIESIIIQSYPNWELCIADDASPDKSVVKLIKEYQLKDSRIKLVERKKNGHISLASNSALELATGSYTALMDHDDVLWPNALHEFVKVIREKPEVDFVYSDEDKLDGTGKIHSYPFLKPDFSPEFLESCNYITHFSCIRTELLKTVGGFRAGYEGAQDWDLFIRLTEVTQNIHHIPKILYSWRIHEGSTASDTDAKPYVYEAQRKLLEDHVTRIGLSGVVKTGLIKQHRTIEYTPPKDSVLSVILHQSSAENTAKALGALSKNSPGVKVDITILGSKKLNETTRKSLSFDSSTEIRFVDSSVELSKVIKDAKGDYVVYISDTFKVASLNWGKTLIGDLLLNKIAFVAPVVLDEKQEVILSAGLGLGYGDNGLQNMLAGSPFEDQHYTRGLYAKSRRNIVVANPGAVAFKKVTWHNTKGGAILEKMANAYIGGMRNLYTPYVQFTTKEVTDLTLDREVINIKQDPSLNPNFKKENGLMEVRS